MSYVPRASMSTSSRPSWNSDTRTHSEKVAVQYRDRRELRLKAQCGSKTNSSVSYNILRPPAGEQKAPVRVPPRKPVPVKARKQLGRVGDKQLLQSSVPFNIIRPKRAAAIQSPVGHPKRRELRPVNTPERPRTAKSALAPDNLSPRQRPFQNSSVKYNILRFNPKSPVPSTATQRDRRELRGAPQNMPAARRIEPSTFNKTFLKVEPKVHRPQSAHRQRRSTRPW